MATGSHAYLKEENILEISRWIQREQDCVRAAEIFLLARTQTGQFSPSRPSEAQQENSAHTEDFLCQL